MAKFGETSTTDEVLAGVNLKGKRVLVTGVSAGLGVETARSLAAHGAQVVGTARDLKKAEAATDAVRKDAAANGGSFELVALDLASLKSARACADGLLKRASLSTSSLPTQASWRHPSVIPKMASRRSSARITSATSYW